MLVSLACQDLQGYQERRATPEQQAILELEDPGVKQELLESVVLLDLTASPVLEGQLAEQELLELQGDPEYRVPKELEEHLVHLVSPVRLVRMEYKGRQVTQEISVNRVLRVCLVVPVVRERRGRLDLSDLRGPRAIRARRAMSAQMELQEQLVSLGGQVRLEGKVLSAGKE